MAKINYPNKNKYITDGVTNKFTDENANEIKTVVNTNYDEFITFQNVIANGYLPNVLSAYTEINVGDFGLGFVSNAGGIYFTDVDGGIYFESGQAISLSLNGGGFIDISGLNGAGINIGSNISVGADSGNAYISSNTGEAGIAVGAGLIGGEVVALPTSGYRTRGKQVIFTSGTAPDTAGRTTLVGGTRLVTTNQVLPNSLIFLSIQSLGTVTTPKPIAVTARVSGVSFTITSSDPTDTSVVAWEIKETE
jgi:hypothetical protein